MVTSTMQRYLFVHELPNTNKEDINHYAVVGVFLCSDFNRQLSGSGIWEQLSNNIPSYDKSVALSNVLYTDLLPTDKSYFYYYGSLTTPPCTYNVHWFVLQNPISVPAEFISKLMDVRASYDNYDYLNFNYRNIKQLNNNVYPYPYYNSKQCSSSSSSSSHYYYY